MKMFNSRKEIANDLGAGVDPNKRGRLPGEWTVKVQAALDAGTHGLIEKVVTPRKAKSVPTALPKTTVVESAPVEDEAPRGPIPPTYRDETHQAYFVNNGERENITLRNACSPCRVSLYFCTCGSPIVSHPAGTHGQVPVVVEAI